MVLQNLTNEYMTDPVGLSDPTPDDCTRLDDGTVVDTRQKAYEFAYRFRSDPDCEALGLTRPSPRDS